MYNNRILFICKKRSSYGISYGLLNSCRFLCNALELMGNDSKLVEVDDNNDIDREITKYGPTHVFIEALWVVPSKFEVLLPLHPHVKWFVRLHSNTPFLSCEGIAMEWLIKYAALGVKYPQFKVAVNAEKLKNDLALSLGIRSVYAPNVYLPHGLFEYDSLHTRPESNTIHIASFGAIRPLKNQLIQAMAAIAFANKIHKKLIYHINATRIESFGEQNGDATLRNIAALFTESPHKLECHEWLNWAEFIQLVSTMDLGLQVSFSETFNIVCGDFVYCNIPIVGSKDIEWMDSAYQADCTDIKDIVAHLQYAWNGKNSDAQVVNRRGLHDWNVTACEVWEDFLKHSTASL